MTCDIFWDAQEAERRHVSPSLVRASSTSLPMPVADVVFGKGLLPHLGKGLDSCLGNSLVPTALCPVYRAILQTCLEMKEKY
jgi:hypothetical protein